MTFWLFAAVLLALTWWAVEFKARSDREQQVQAVVRGNANLARAFEEHIVRTLAAVDQTVLFVKYQYERHGEQIDIREYAREGMIADDLFNQIGVIDARGTYLISNLADHRRIDLSDREHFRVHAEGRVEGLFVSKPVLGRASGKWSLQLTRRIDRPDGSFGGIVVASIDPFYFTRLYSSVDLGQRGVVVLAGDDGVIRARRSGDQVSTGQVVGDSPIYSRLAGERAGNYIALSQVDRVSRIYAFRRLEGHPMTVVVGVDEAEAMLEVESRIGVYRAFAAVASTVIVLFALAATVMLRRQRAISARLEASQARAEEASRLKTEFLASMSHELRTPLNGIIGYAEFLHDAAPAGREREFAGVIMKSGQHLLELVNSILDLSKVEAGRLELMPTEVALRTLLDEAAATHHPGALAKGLVLVVDSDTDVPATVRCDRTRVLQVLNNLLHNAVKFTEHGRVTLRAASVAGGLAFEVTDTGCGIAPDFQTVLFEKFRQADAFVTRRHGGTGLGLALSRELAHRMGGSLSVRSAVGEGSTFTFVLPTVPPGGTTRTGS
ncbi:MAG: hybrid sensor histidine kinase/response regulator [Burkholderiales bacterium]|nr:MAG: hybrid sensor histidine kinase/response regulator [Burkholderiales bacterium]